MNLRTMTKTKLMNRNLQRHFVRVSVFAFVFAICSSAVASSNTMSLPVILSFPASSTSLEESLVKFGNTQFQSGFDVSQTLDDVTITDPFAIHLSGVHFKTRLHGRLDRDASGLLVESTLNDLELTIDRISIHSVVDLSISGVDAHIRVDAECSGTKMSWPNQSLSLFARARLATQPNLKLNVRDLALPTNLSRPEMTLSCQGPYGIETTIRDNAWAALQTRWTDPGFARTLEVEIGKYFETAMKDGGTGFNLLSQPNFKMALRPGVYEATKLGSHLRATLELNLDRPAMVTKKSLAATVLKPTETVNRLTLTLPVISAQSLVQSWFAVGVWSEWFEAQTLDGFRELMSSRFKQFFAWPDLMNYDKHAPFWFVLKAKSRPTMRCENGALGLSMPMTASMLLQDSKYEIGYKKMLDFDLPTQVKVSLPQVRTKTPLAMTIQSMNFGATFDRRYVQTENPNTSLDAGAIGDAVREYADNSVKDIGTLEGALGSGLRFMNQTDASCDSSQQMLRLGF